MNNNSLMTKLRFSVIGIALGGVILGLSVNIHGTTCSGFLFLGSATIVGYASRLVQLYKKGITYPLLDMEAQIDRALNSPHGRVRIKNQTAPETQAIANSVNRLFSALQARENKLVETQRSAIAAEKAKSDFLCNMSHEIRTPLNAVVGVAQLLLEARHSEETRLGLNSIVDAAEGLVTVLSDVIDLADLQTGRLSLHPTPVNVGMLVENTIDRLRQRAEEKQLSVFAEIKTSVPQVLMLDERAMQQVVRNLLDNAIKFSKKGQVVAVIVECAETNPDIGTLNITIVDTGAGISDEQKQLLFRDFQQLDYSSTRSVGGLGVGLALCQRLASLMNGTLICRSRKNVGSAFQISIPAKLISIREAVITGTLDFLKNPPIHSPRKHAKGPPLSVLVVEDNLMNAKVVTKMLENLRATVVLAENGEKALEELERGSFDLILMDCQMPVMDGLEATRRIRQKERETSTRTPIIALTANAIAGDREKCLGAGMDEYMTKPISKKQFIEKIKEILNDTGDLVQ